jgi:MFS transporter, MHS family, proline/betaine transporter
MSTAEISPELTFPRSLALRAMCGGIVGNVLEWYDFAVYGYFAQSIGRQFFPADDPSSELLASFGTFAAGFMMRPLGGLVFGLIADRTGRGLALTLSVVTMALPTFLIGVLPGYDVLGVIAPIMLVALRMIQGLAVGGEYTTSAVYLAECARPSRRGVAASWSPFGATGGTLLGSFAGMLTTAALPAASLDAWGWRIPFLFGLLVGVLGLLLRRHMPEPPPEDDALIPAPAAAAVAPRSRMRRLFAELANFEWRIVGVLLCLNAFLSVGFYLCFVFSVSYFTDFVHVSAQSAFKINTISMIVLLFSIPASGALSDVVGRKALLLTSTAGGCLLSWPLFWLMHRPEPNLMLCGQIGLALLVGMFSGTLPVAMTEALPRRIRCTGLSVSYNLGMAILGGTAPLVATYLIRRTHNDLYPAYYLAAAAFLSFASTLMLKEAARPAVARPA